MIRIAALTIYPIKSAAGIDVDTMGLDEFGAAGDRRWLVIDEAGTAITARTHHALVTVRPTFATDSRNGAIVLNAPACTALRVEVPTDMATVHQATVWDDTIPARDAGDEAAAWLRDRLGVPCRLVHLDPAAQRPLRTKYAGPVSIESRRVAFSDGAPLLLLGLPAVDALADRLSVGATPTRIDRRRFRANIWLDGLEAHEEDTWRAVRIGDVTIGVGNHCPRCVFTTVDPDSAVAGVEPMRTLATYRQEQGAVVFGVNATHATTGVIRVGDVVTVLERR